MWLRKPRLRSILHEKAKIHNVGGEVANTPGIEELASTIYAFAPASDVALKAASESCKPHEIAKALMARANSDLIRQMVAAAPFSVGLEFNRSYCILFASRSIKRHSGRFSRSSRLSGSNAETLRLWLGLCFSIGITSPPPCWISTA